MAHNSVFQQFHSLKLILLLNPFLQMHRQSQLRLQLGYMVQSNNSHLESLQMKRLELMSSLMSWSMTTQEVQLSIDIIKLIVIYVKFQSQYKGIHMENLKIKIQPIQLNYKSDKNLSFILKFKRILITTSHELQKSECKKKFILLNQKASFESEQAIKTIQISKQFELNNTKVDIFFVQCSELQHNKWKPHIKLLGIATIDLGLFEGQSQYALSQQPCQRQYQVKLDKCDDKNSTIKFLISFQPIQIKKRKVQENNAENGILKTQSFHKETLISKRRAKPDVPTAYEISRKNYKNINISRCEENTEKSKSSKGSVASYRRRFEYQQTQNKKKHNQTMRIFPQKKDKNKNISPMPRLKTPEPISSIEKYTVQTVKHNGKFSHLEVNKRKVEEEKKEKEEIYVVSKSQLSQYEFGTSDLMDKDLSIESSNLESIKENKYKIISEKLEAIDRKINQKKQQTPQSQIQEVEERPRQLIEPQLEQKKQEKSQSNSFETNMIESHVSRFSPATNIMQEQTKQKVDETVELAKNQMQSPYFSPAKLNQQNDQVKSAKNDENLKKIQELEQQIDDLQENQRVRILEIELEHKNKLKQIEKERKQMNEEIIHMKKENSSKENIIQKINKLYEQLDDKCFEIEKASERKYEEYEREIQRLLQKNNQIQIELNEMKERQPATQRTQRKSYEEEYTTEKKRVVNLQAQLRLKENELKFMKIKFDNVLQQKHELEEQIVILQRKNEKELSRKSSIAKLSMENESISNTVKMQNKALKEEIQSLHRQVSELNYMLEGMINQKRSIDREEQKQRHDEESWKNLNRKYQALQRQIQAYESELQEKKVKIADIINVIWKFGNAELIEEIDRSIGIQ